MTRPNDDSLPESTPESDEERIERYRRMEPWEKLEEVFRLNHEVEQRHRARITAQYGDISEEEMRLRLGALRLGREIMVKVFGWDPDEKGW